MDKIFTTKSKNTAFAYAKQKKN